MLGSLASLENLNVGECAVADELVDTIASHTRLKSLDFFHCVGISDEKLMDILTKLPRLQSLTFPSGEKSLDDN